MKKKLIGLFLVILLALVFAGCSNNTVTDDTSSEPSELPKSEQNIEPPVATVKDNTGLPGTWELVKTAENAEFDMVLALNDDGTFELYLNGETPGFMNASFRTLLDGEYTDENNQLKLEFNDPTEASIELNLNSYTFDYVLNGDSLSLTQDGTTYDMTRVVSE